MRASGGHVQPVQTRPNGTKGLRSRLYSQRRELTSRWPAKEAERSDAMQALRYPADLLCPTSPFSYPPYLPTQRLSALQAFTDRGVLSLTSEQERIRIGQFPKVAIHQLRRLTPVQFLFTNHLNMS